MLLKHDSVHSILPAQTRRCNAGLAIVWRLLSTHVANQIAESLPRSVKSRFLCGQRCRTGQSGNFCLLHRAEDVHESVDPTWSSEQRSRSMWWASSLAWRSLLASVSSLASSKFSWVQPIQAI